MTPQPASTKTFCSECGAEKRSKREHDTLFGYITLCWENWPLAHPFKPTDAEHLRAWSLIQVGHFESLDVTDVCEGNPLQIALVVKFFTHGRRDYRLVNTGNRLVAYRPRTIKRGPEGIPVKEYRQIASAVYETLQEITGIDVEAYKQNRRQAKHGHDRPSPAEARS